MLVDYLMLALGVAAISQPTPARRKVAAVFASLALLHCVIGERLDGLAYYASAATFDAMIITITANLKETPNITRQLHRICLTSIVLNFLGWVAYMLYLPPTGYNLSFVFLHLWAIIVLITKDARYAGDSTMDWWAYYVRFNSYKRFNNCK